MERIPKNIRQIGGREEKLKTYVEDYVGTYLRKLQEEREENGAVGMLAGQWQRDGDNECVFISGALEVHGAHTDGGGLGRRLWIAEYVFFRTGAVRDFCV